MADYDSDDVFYILHSDPQLRGGRISASLITRAHLNATGKPVPNLTWVFALGFLSSLGLIWLSIQLLTGAPLSLINLAIVAVPWLASYYVLGGDLAFFRLPFKSWVKGTFLLLVAAAVAVIYFYFPDSFQLAASSYGLGAGVSTAVLYGMALGNQAYRTAAENVRCVLTQYSKDVRGRELRNQFSTLLYAGTFDAALRKSDTSEDAVREQLKHMSYLNGAGLEEARRQFEMRANNRP